MRNRSIVRRVPQSGMVLIDGLIAIVMFSIGILGMVALQGTAVKLSTDAKVRTDAAMLADQVVAQMWGSDPTPAALAAAYAGSGGVGGTGYTAWAALLASSTTGLPGVTATANQPSIQVDSSTTSNLVTVTVNWQSPNDSGPHSYVSVTQITR